MLRYALGGLAAFLIISVGAFLIIAWFNDDGVEAGPAPQVAVFVADSGVTRYFEFRELPAGPIVLERGKLYELRIVNETSHIVNATIDGAGIEQLPFDEIPRDTHAPPLVQHRVALSTQRDGSSASYTRFSESGDFELRIETLGGNAEPYTLPVVVE